MKIARAMRATGEKTRRIAETLGLAQTTIMRILNPTYNAKEHAPFCGTSKVWARILKAAKIAKRTTIHDLRRTFCTNMLEADVPLPIVSAAMGHKSMATTQRHYAFARQHKVANAVQAGVAGMLADALQARKTMDARKAG